MKAFLLVLIIITVALFTGTWIFGGLEWVFEFLARGCSFLGQMFNLFGWNTGIF